MKKRILAISAATLMLVGCAEDDPKKLGCRSISDINKQEMLAGLTPQYKGKLTIGRTQAIRSNDYQRIHFVAAEILPGVDGENPAIGVWLMNRVQEPVGFVAVMPGPAADISVYPNASKTKMEATRFSHGYSTALRCLDIVRAKK